MSDETESAQPPPDYHITVDIMQQRCIINASRIRVAGDEFQELMKRLNDRELTPALLRQAAHLMTRLADVIDEGMLDRHALNHILLQAAEHRQAEEEPVEGVSDGCSNHPPD